MGEANYCGPGFKRPVDRSSSSTCDIGRRECPQAPFRTEDCISGGRQWLADGDLGCSGKHRPHHELHGNGHCWHLLDYVFHIDRVVHHLGTHELHLVLGERHGDQLGRDVGFGQGGFRGTIHTARRSDSWTWHFNWNEVERSVQPSDPGCRGNVFVDCEWGGAEEPQVGCTGRLEWGQGRDLCSGNFGELWIDIKSRRCRDVRSRDLFVPIR